MIQLSRVPALLTSVGLILGSMTSADAAFTSGTQGLADVGSPTTNTAALADATVFTLGNILTTAAETGSFAIPDSTLQFLGSAVLDLSNIPGFSLGTADFGVFTASGILGLVDTPLVRAFYLSGTFTPGTRYGANLPADSASLLISFTQANGPGTAISDSSTLSVPAAAVPEPTSVAMLGLGLVGSLGVAARRRLN